MVRPLTERKEISLWWRKQNEANDKRNNQPFEAFTDKLTARSGNEGKPGARSSQEKEQRHSPLRTEDNQDNQTCALSTTPDMPVEHIENVDGVSVKHAHHG